MTCIISTLEKNWYLFPLWGKKILPLEANLLERVYLKTTRTFGYCCGVEWHLETWLYTIVCDYEILRATKYQIIGLGRVQSTNLRNPTFGLGDRVILPSLAHGTKQRLIVGIQLVNNSWCYAVEMMSPTLTTSNRFALVSERDLIRVLL
jgi:hypothetical protein